MTGEAQGLQVEHAAGGPALRLAPWSRAETAFFMPELADNNSFEQWQLDGSKDATARALETARRLLDG